MLPLDPEALAEKPPRAIIFGVSGITLTDGEKQFFRYANPFGFILFGRNCVNPQQVKTLVADLRASVGRADAPIVIDQEGGRVARLKPPHWPAYPPAKMFGDLAKNDMDMALEAARINAQLIGLELYELGFTINCAPLADVLTRETDQAIGDRAFSENPDVVAECARAYAEGLMESGILPVIKHMPGHGRTGVDPHRFQSVVTASRAELEAQDFLPFKALRDMPIGMTCHILFTALDNKNPASLSPVVHHIIRREIGFDGLLFSDDINMKGIMGRQEDLAVRALQAGSDVALHCNGNMNEMVAVSAATPVMRPDSMARWQRAAAHIKRPSMFVDKAGLMDRLDMLLGVAALTNKTN